MKRKLLLAIATIFFLSSVCYAEDVFLSVAMPQNSLLDNNSKTLLKNKLIDVISTQGIAATECSAIAVIPDVAVSDEKIVEGGMQNIYVQQLSITFTIRNVLTNTVFNSIQISCSGEGYSISEARRSAIRKVNVSSPLYIEFIASSKNKICDYYSKNTALIINKANTLASLQEYDEALALLATYPEHLSGYTQVSQTIRDIFNRNQTKYCSQILQLARQAYSTRDYQKASEMVALVDPQSSCSGEANQLLSQIKEEVDREYSDSVSLEMEKIKSKERIQSQLISAARDISVAYYKRQTQYVFFW